MNLSFILPVCNEQDNIFRLHKELVFSISELPSVDGYEIIYVDDGSTDGSYEILGTLENERVRVFHFDENRGKANALMFGINSSSYNTVVTMDADLQDNPSEIAKLIAEKNKGYDIVSGYKKRRKDKFTVVLVSRFINKLLSFLYKSKIRDVNSGYKIMDKKILEGITLIEGFHRYLPILVMNNGYKYSEVEVVHRPRINGKSKYSVLKIFPSFLDLLLILIITKRYVSLVTFATLSLLIAVAICLMVRVFIEGVFFLDFLLVLYGAVYGLLFYFLLKKHIKYKHAKEAF